MIDENTDIENEIIKEDDTLVLIKWFKEKWRTIEKEQASDFVNIIYQINSEEDIKKLLNIAFESVGEDINKLIEMLETVL